MSKTALGVKLAHNELWTVRLRTAWNRTAVERVDRTFRADASAGSELPEADRGMTVAGAVPTDGVFHRKIVLPFSDPRKLARAAPLEAEETLPLPLEELVCDVQLGKKKAGGSEVMVVAAPEDRVERLLHDLKHAGWEPSALDVEALALASVGRRAVGPEETAVLIDVSAELTQAVILSRDEVKSFHACASSEIGPELLRELHAYLVQGDDESQPSRAYLTGRDSLEVDEAEWTRALGLPVQRLPFAPLGVDAGAEALLTWPTWAIPLGLALRAAGRRPAFGVNLLRGPFAVAKGEPPWKQAGIASGVFFAILAVLWAGTTWLEASQLEKRQRTLEQSIRRVFQQAMPDVRNIVSEVSQLRTRVTGLEERDRSLGAITNDQNSPLAILRDLSAKIARDTEVEFRDLSIDGEKLRIEGATTSYRMSERVKSEIMAAFPRFTTASSDARDGSKPGEILFTLSVNLSEKR